MGIKTIISFFTFCLVTGGLLSTYTWLETRRRRSLIRKRLVGAVNPDEKGQAPEKKVQKAASFWRPALISLGLTAAPKKESELVDIRKQLGYAGYRSPSAPIMYFGFKLGLALVLGSAYLLLCFFSGGLSLKDLAFTFFPLALGYYLPGLFLKFQISSRQKRIFKELPDALDLLLICIEAGLSFDMALYRVSRELALLTPVLAKEFGQYFLEIQSGLPRREVLANLGSRNGVKSLTSVINMLLQSMKFGTDIAEALRVYSASMRTERRQIAEEKAAKISPKLTFPMVMLILPALLVVILGPAVINLISQLGDMF